MIMTRGKVRDGNPKFIDWMTMMFEDGVRQIDNPVRNEDKSGEVDTSIWNG